MAIMFAEASISEKGTINGVKGDQANEIRLSTPYIHNKGWRVFRHHNANTRKWIGINGRVIAQNQCFGYGQSDRVSGYNACKSAGWEPANVKTNCNLDCSEMARTCLACALEKDIADFNTANEASVLLSAGMKEVTDWTLETLQHGDILVTKMKAHSVIVTDTSITACSSTQAPASNPKYKVLANSLTVRSGAGTSYKAIDYIHAGEIYEVSHTSGNWGYLPAKKGWCSLASKYMQKV